MPWIQFRDERFSFDEIEGRRRGDVNAFTSSVLADASAWLSGAQSYTFHTSGSTGKPKALVFTRKQIVHSITQTAESLGLNSGQTALLCLDPNYTGGRMVLLRSLHLGMNLIAVEPRANPFLSLEQNIKVDVTSLVPYQLQAILKENPDRLNSLGAVLVGGGSLSNHLTSALANAACPVYLTYGMTETLSHIALRKVSGSSPDHHFTVFPDISIDQDERGCLVIQASYLGDEPIVTNDLVELSGPDRFEWKGRIDHAINSGGIKMIPEILEPEIEMALHEIGVSTNFFLAGREHPTLGEEMMLVLEGKPLTEAQQQTLLERLRSRLGTFQSPRLICFIPQFAYAANEKINREKTLSLLPTQS
jgi:o-succinylbenzoate---CoA ligase